MDKKEQIEEYRDIKGYEGYYQVSNLGNVKSVNRNVNVNDRYIRVIKERILKQGTMTSGYPFVTLALNAVNKSYGVHILLAKAFIPNPENKKCVNHINGVKTDNRLENLEWMTYKENAIHAVKTGLTKYGESHRKAVSKMVIDTHTGTIYDSITDAVKTTRFTRNYIYSMLQGKVNNCTDLEYYNPTS